MTDPSAHEPQPQPTHTPPVAAASPRLHPFIAQKPVPPVSSPPRHGVRVLSPTKPTRHLSPRKYQQLQQQQRQAVHRNMNVPLSPLAHQSPVPASVHHRTNKEPVPWNPAWLPFPIDNIPVVTAKSIGGAGLSLGSSSLDQWLQAFDHDILQYESLEKFAQVKLPEALAFCEKMEQQIAEIEEREQAEADAQAESDRERSMRRGLGGASPAGSGSGRVPRRARVATSAMTRFPVRFRVAVFASLVERAIVAMTQSAALAHLKPWLLQARQELFRAVFADYDQYSSRHRTTRKKPHGVGKAESASVDQVSEPDDQDDDEEEDSEKESEAGDSDEEDHHSENTQHKRSRPRRRAASMATRFGPDAPRPLSFFLSRVPFLLKLQDDSQKRTTRFQRHQVVLRRIVQSLYRSLGSVFHAWKTFTRQRREERLHNKGAQLTAMVVIQRGLVRSVFVEWSKCTLQTKLSRARDREASTKRAHDERVNELYKELFLLREQNARLERELARAQRGNQHFDERDENDDSDADDA